MHASRRAPNHQTFSCAEKGTLRLVQAPHVEGQIPARSMSYQHSCIINLNNSQGIKL